MCACQVCCDLKHRGDIVVLPRGLELRGLSNLSSPPAPWLFSHSPREDNEKHWLPRLQVNQLVSASTVRETRGGRVGVGTRIPARLRRAQEAPRSNISQKGYTQMLLLPIPGDREN